MLPFVLQHLIALRNNTRIEYWNIRQDANLDYGDIQAWQREYKFLPNMTRPTDVVSVFTDVQAFDVPAFYADNKRVASRQSRRTCSAQGGLYQFPPRLASLRLDSTRLAERHLHLPFFERQLID